MFQLFYTQRHFSLKQTCIGRSVRCLEESSSSLHFSLKQTCIPTTPSAKLGEGDSTEEEKSEVCRDFNAATVTAVNAHLDGCLAEAVWDERRQTRRTCPKPKAKAPKKRSIAEILMVALDC